MLAKKFGMLLLVLLELQWNVWLSNLRNVTEPQLQTKLKQNPLQYVKVQSKITAMSFPKDADIFINSTLTTKEGNFTQCSIALPSASHTLERAKTSVSEKFSCLLSVEIIISLLTVPYNCKKINWKAICREVNIH